MQKYSYALFTPTVMWDFKLRPSFSGQSVPVMKVNRGLTHLMLMNQVCYLYRDCISFIELIEDRACEK